MPNNHHPQFRGNVFHPQADPTIVHRSPTPIPVLTDERTTIAHPAGTPRSHSLDVEQTFAISPHVARLPADRAERRPTSAATHTNTSQPGREHSLPNGEGVLLEGASPYSASSSGTNTRRPNVRGYSHTSQEPRERGVRRDPDNIPASRELLERPLRGVRQDKARSKSARVSSRQPAAGNEIPRSPFTNTAGVRSPSAVGAKQKRVQVTLWVDPAVKAHLERLAEKEGLSVSAAAAAFLRRALQQDVDLEYSALLQPIIETAIAKHMRGISTRLAWLLVRVAFDAGQTRSLVTNILGRQPGVSQSLLKTFCKVAAGRPRPTSCAALPRSPASSRLLSNG